MPLRVDILLVRREGGQLSEAKRQEISALLPLLNRFTLIEFKGPTDAMEQGDFAQLVGCSFLWHSQENEPVPHEEVSLVVLAPTVSGPLRDELRALGFEASQHEPGIFRVTGLPFATWLVETDVMAERGQPVLSLVSRVFLNDRGRIIEELDARAMTPCCATWCNRSNSSDSRGEGFAMQHGLSDDIQEMQEVGEELLTKILEWVPPERRLRGLSPEELVAGLTDEQAARLRELLDRQQGR